MLPVRGIIFPEGNISGFIRYGNYFALGRGERFQGNVTASVPDGTERFQGNVTASVPDGTEPGIYEGSIYIYSSPYWMILPPSFLQSMSGPGAVVAFSLVSAVIMAMVTSLLLVALSFAIERYLLARNYMAWKMLPVHARMNTLYGILHSLSRVSRTARRKAAGAFGWMNGELHWVEFGMKKPFIASVAGFASSLITGTLAYALGCRWRAEVMFSAILVDVWFSSVLGMKTFYHIFRTNHSLLVPFSSAVTIAGILLFLFAVMAVPACLLSWLPGYAIHSAREKFDYELLLRRCDL